MAKEKFLLHNILCMRGCPACARLLLPIQFETKLSKFSALSSHMINYLITEFSWPERENILAIGHVAQPKYFFRPARPNSISIYFSFLKHLIGPES